MSKTKKTSHENFQNNRLEEILDRISDAFVSLDKNWCYTYMNKKAGEIVGRNPEQMIGKNMWEEFPALKEEPLELHDAYRKAMKDQKSVSVEHYYKPFNKWFDTRIYPSHEGLTIYFNDITERKNAKEKLTEQESQLRLFIKYSPVALVMLDKEMKYLEVSNLWIDDYSIDRRDITGKSHYEVFPEIPEHWKEIHRHCLAGHTAKKEEDLLIRADGSEEWLRWEIHPWYKATDEVGGIIIFSEIITERKRAELQLQKNISFTESIINASPDIIYIYDIEEGKNVYVNDGIEQNLGFTGEEIKKMGDQVLPTLVHPEDLIFYMENTYPRYFTVKDKEIFITQYRMKNKKEEWRWLQSKESVFLRNEVGTARQIFGMATDITEQKNKATELQLSEERYRSLFEQASDPIMITDQTGNFLDVNTRFCTMFGYTKKELLHTNIRMMIDPEHLKAEPMHFEELLSGGHVFSQRRMLHKNGTVITVEANVKMVPDGRILAIARDITERKITENKLEESEKKLRQVLSSSSDNFYVVDKNYNVILINETAIRNLEIAWGKTIKPGTNLLDVIPRQGDEPIRENFEKVFTGEKIEYELHHSHSDLPTWTLVSFTPVSDEAGTITGAYVVAKDITNRKKAEEAIKESEEKFRAIVRDQTEMIVRWKPGGIRTFVNQAYCNLYKVRPEEVIGTSFFSSVVPTDLDNLKKRIHSITPGNPINTATHSIHRPDGSIGWQEWTDRGFFDEEGKIIDYQSTGRDVTEQKLAEEKLKKSELNYRSIFNNVSDAICIYELNSISFLDVNERFGEITGYTVEELKNLTVEDISTNEPPYIMENLLKLMEKAAAGEPQTFDWITKNKDKSQTYVEVSLRKIILEGKPHLAAIVRDITERKKSLEQIKFSNEQLRQLTAHLQTIREEERSRIGQEIHDQLGQHLTVLKMDVSRLKKNIPIHKNKEEDLAEILGELDNCLQMVRKISADLRPSIIDDLGLIAAFEWQSEDFEKRTEISTKFYSNTTELNLPQTHAIGLFRIFQESLTNVARHAEAKEVVTALNKENGFVILTITDDGKGFDTNSVGGKRSLGLLGMKERTFLMNGNYEINSIPGKGTEVKVIIPV